jgi:hypothetical protein
MKRSRSINAEIFYHVSILRIKKQLKHPGAFLRKPGENQVKTWFSLGFQLKTRE